MDLTLFEDRTERIDLNSFSRSDLFSLQEKWTSNGLVISANGDIRAHGYVGYAARGATRLQVLPKVFSKGKVTGKDEISQSVRLLVGMLKSSGFDSITKITDESLGVHSDDILELFISIFLGQLRHELLHNCSREYQSNEEQGVFVRGKILHGKTILASKDLAFPLVLELDEFTIDNTLNRVLKSTVVLLREHSADPENLSIIRKVLHLLDGVSTIPLTQKDFERIRFHRQNENFRRLVNMARQFFLGGEPSFYRGQIRSLSFLVPLYKVFEFYLYKLFCGQLLQLGYYVGHEKPTKDLLDNLDGTTSRRLEPDIVIQRDGKTVLILDAKYKDPFDNGDVSPQDSDMYQLLGYASVFGCHSVGLVYPSFGDGNFGTSVLGRYKFRVASGEVDFSVITVDIIHSSPEQLSVQLAEIAQELMSVSPRKSSMDTAFIS